MTDKERILFLEKRIDVLSERVNLLSTMIEKIIENVEYKHNDEKKSNIKNESIEQK